MVLMSPALAASEYGGKQWKAWSSRCVSALPEISSCTRQPHVISCYAFTRAASREEEDNFLTELNAL